MDPLKSESYHEIPGPLKGWRQMRDREGAKAFEKCPKDFQRKAIKYLSRTEASLGIYLARLEALLAQRRQA
jgi:hypothetical protein